MLVMTHVQTNAKAGAATFQYEAQRTLVCNCQSPFTAKTSMTVEIECNNQVMMFYVLNGIAYTGSCRNIQDRQITTFEGPETVQRHCMPQA